MAFKLETPHKEKTSMRDIEVLLKKEIVFFGSGFNNKKKQAFYQELFVLLNAGITIKDSLSLIIESQKQEIDKRLIHTILKEIVNGKLFSEAILNLKQFSEYEYYSLKIGEETSTTSIVVKELEMFYERKNEQRRIVLAAMTYPSIVLTTAFFVVVFMLSYVVPMFQDIFRQNNMELPWLTKSIIILSNYMKSYGIYFGLILLTLFFLSRVFKETLYIKKSLHYFLLKIPILNTFTTKVYLAQFTQALTLLTASKIPILNSIQIVRKMIRFVPLQDALQNVEDNIIKGNSLSVSMDSSQLFDKRIISLVKVAEETNQTEYVFKQLNEQYNQEVVQQSKTMTTIFEPLIILFVGAVVGVLLVAMYLPMFQLSSAIG